MSVNTVKYSMKSRAIRFTLFSSIRVSFYLFGVEWLNSTEASEAFGKQGIWFDSG